MIQDAQMTHPQALFLCYAGPKETEHALSRYAYCAWAHGMVQPATRLHLIMHGGLCAVGALHRCASLKRMECALSRHGGRGWGGEEGP